MIRAIDLTLMSDWLEPDNGGRRKQYSCGNHNHTKKGRQPTKHMRALASQVLEMPGT